MRGVISITILIGISFLLAGCKTIHEGERHETLSINSKIPVLHKTTNDSPALENEPSDKIDLNEALDAALRLNPGLAAAKHNVKSYEGVIRQAGALPDPVLSGEIEEFGGSGGFDGTGAMSSKIGISQEIPIAGQLSKRRSVAKTQKSIAESEFSAQTIELKTEVKKRFLSVYVFQEKLKLEEENLSILRSIKDGVVKRVIAGEVSPLDEVKVNVQLESAEITLLRTKRELEAAKYKLASTWGKEIPRFKEVEFDLNEDLTFPDEEKMLEQIILNPTCIILKKNVLLASSNLDLARSEKWMDIEVGGGVQRFNETGDHAYFLEVSIPLPIFNRNKGNIEEAIYMRNRAQKELEAGILELRAELRELVRRAESVQGAYSSMRTSVIPAAEKAYNSVIKAYEAGEVGYLELLEAQRTHLETRREHLELFQEFQELKIEIEALTSEGSEEN